MSIWEDHPLARKYLDDILVVQPKIPDEIHEKRIDSLRRKMLQMESLLSKEHTRSSHLEAKNLALSLLVKHIKGETWYKIGKKLGMLKHRVVADFK